jgi:hypothetical protein
MAEHLAPPSKIPSYATSFIGREREIIEILHELRTTKHLTFTGTPGSGKTRLAREVADQLTGLFPDGVWWCDMAAITDPAHVPQAVASALHLTEGPSRSLWDTIVEAVGARRAVLVLDSCEHLSACGPLAQGAHRCPNLACWPRPRRRSDHEKVGPSRFPFRTSDPAAAVSTSFVRDRAQAASHA